MLHDNFLRIYTYMQSTTEPCTLSLTATPHARTVHSSTTHTKKIQNLGIPKPQTTLIVMRSSAEILLLRSELLMHI